jgi:cellulose synthase/poly-beta-1,6-N-acetylglucosamine synthase-like glycosyltransferase
MIYFYYFLAAVSAWFGFQSLLSGFRYVRYVRQETSKPLPNFTPTVSVIAPSRGLEDGLADNFRALLTQDYPDYEVVFVFDRTDDPAVDLLSEIPKDHVTTRLIFSGPATDSGQKVHNLRAGVNETRPESEVLVFVDTDARPGQHWLRQLVAPLADSSVTASSGYRWFVPLKGGLPSRLRSIWNASVASALGHDRQKNFCWGGSTAIRRSVFEQLNIRERWRGSVSDDFTMTNVIKEAGLPIHFTPNCLVASVGDCGLRELFEFTTRQIQITRVYASHLWLPLLLGSSLFAIVFYGGILLLISRVALGFSYLVLVLVLCFLFALGAMKAFIRWQVINVPLARYRKELRRDLLAHVFLWPVASLLYLYNAIVAGFSRRIKWRGITYELKSPTEAVIISRD